MELKVKLKSEHIEVTSGTPSYWRSRFGTIFGRSLGGSSASACGCPVVQAAQIEYVCLHVLPLGTAG